MASSVNIVPDILKWWIQQVKKNVIFFFLQELLKKLQTFSF